MNLLWYGLLQRIQNETVMKAHISLYSNFFTCTNIFFSGDQLLHGRTICWLAETAKRTLEKQMTNNCPPSRALQCTHLGLSFRIKLRDFLSCCSEMTAACRTAQAAWWVYITSWNAGSPQLHHTGKFDCFHFTNKKTQPNHTSLMQSVISIPQKSLCTFSFQTRNFRWGQLYRCEQWNGGASFGISVTGSRCPGLVRVLGK